jgi:hypothetical protein
MLVARQLCGFVLGSMALVLTTGTGCERVKATEYVAGFSTQVQVPREFKTIEISVWVSEDAAKPPALVECHHADVVNGRARLPKTLGVSRETDNRSMMVSLLGFVEDSVTVERERSDCGLSPKPTPTGTLKEPRVLRRSRQNYRDGRILYLPMPLKYACFDVSCLCPKGTQTTPDKPCEDPNGQQTDVTCAAGRCVPGLRDERVFRDYSGELGQTDSSVCFSLQRCLSDAVVPTTENADDCTYSIPGTLDGMNVRAIYEGFVSEVLDEDKMPPGFEDLAPADQEVVRKDIELHAEGFTNLGSGKFRLARGLCDLTKPTSTAPHKLLSVVASRSCPPKPPEQPVCDEGTEVLIPSPSRLLVLLDRSATTGDLAESVDKILGLTLDDPVFSRTEIGFKWLPSLNATNACGAPEDYSDATKLDVPFMPALAARDKIADAIRIDAGKPDKNGVLPPPAPAKQAFASVQNALGPNGAYALLASLQQKDAAAKKALNVASVVLITSNNVGNDCSGIAAPAFTTAAEDFKKNKRIYTYVFQLPQGESTDPGQAGRQARSDACVALASKGGFEPDPASRCVDASDATNDNKEKLGEKGLQMLGKLVGDLAGCLYERPGTLSDSAAKVGFSVVLAPGTPAAFREVKFNAGCNDDPNNTIDGWNFEPAPDGNLVRLCGQACIDLRNQLGLQTGLAAAKSAAGADAGAPAVQPEPVLVTSTQKTPK